MAYGATGDSTLSKSITTYYYLRPTTAVISPESKTIKVKWDKNKKVKGYEVEYSTSQKFKSNTKVKITKNTTVKKEISNLKSQNIYYVRVRSYNGKYVSAWSAVKKIKVK